MREFIANCQKLQIGESITQPFSDNVRLVCDRQEDGLLFMLNVYDGGGNIKDVVGTYYVKDISEDTVKRMVITIVDNVYESILVSAYKKYQMSWCEERGFDFEEVVKAYMNDEEYQGQMFVCMDEFECCEFQEEDIVEDYLSPDDFKIYTFVMNMN